MSATTTTEVVIDVRGVPRPQGSIRPVRTKNGGVFMKYADTLHPWRAQVQQAIIDAGHERFTEAVELELRFDLTRPSFHYLPINSKRTVREVRRYMPAWPIAGPDLDKLVRAIGDSLTAAGLLRDDQQIVSLRATKCYADPPGVLITLRSMTEEP